MQRHRADYTHVEERHKADRLRVGAPAQGRLHPCNGTGPTTHTMTNGTGPIDSSWVQRHRADYTCATPQGRLHTR